MLFSHARQGPDVCSAISQMGVNACLVMSPQTVEELLRHLCLARLNPKLFPMGNFGQKDTRRSVGRNLLLLTMSYGEIMSESHCFVMGL